MNELMKRTPLAFDYQSSTPCDNRVIEAMAPYLYEVWGNPSSMQNSLGIHASAATSFARENLASILKIDPQRVIFTSGATEANNLALLGHARSKAFEKGTPGHLITLSTEHNSVIEPLLQLRKEGFRISELRPNSDGLLILEDLVNAFQEDTFLVSIMAANNEIGVLQPIKKIGLLCKERGISFHCDTAQAFGNLVFDIDQIGIDLLTISGHKIYGPKGIGALIISDKIKIQPLQFGGNQENGIRPGTLPVPLVVGFSKAAEIAQDMLLENMKRHAILRDKLWIKMQNKVPDIILNGSLEKRLPNNLNFTIKGVRGTQLHKQLRPFIACSSGSACSNGKPSHVLLSLGRTKQEAEASLRLSIGRSTTLNEIDAAIEIISREVDQLRS